MTLKAERYAANCPQSVVSFVRNELPFLSFARAMEWYQSVVPRMHRHQYAFVAANDRFLFLTQVLRRPDAIHEWLYDRCREVEAAPDDHLDLWSRYHFKSSIITFAGAIHEIVNNPEITIAIFGGTLEIARPFLDQIKMELEENPALPWLYPDVFWANPRKEAPRWSAEDGIVVKRSGNPKEATIEAHGIVEAMPTGRHFGLRIYDDMVNERMVTNDTMIKKILGRWELSQNLGAGVGGDRRWHAGTRYCTIGGMRIMMADWTMKPISDVRIGDMVIGWERRDGKRWIRPAKVVNRGIHLAQPVNRYTFDTGRHVTCTADHRWWQGAHGSGKEYQPIALARQREGRKNRLMQPRGTRDGVRELLVPMDVDQSRSAGWLAAIFDGEGTIWKNSNHPSGAISICQSSKNMVVVERIRSVLRELNFDFREHWVFAEGRERMDHDRCNFYIHGGWRERYRFLAAINPERKEKLAATLFGQLTTEKRRLVSVDAAGEQDVHWLETETGNYTVEGFCSSNSYADAYGSLIERGSLIPRIYPATENGRLDGKPVLLSQEKWNEIKRDQKSTVSAQMLLNPVAGNETIFLADWLRPYAVRPRLMTVYILVDPSKGRSANSDRTAIAVIGIDSALNRYFLDGYCHRMKLSERYQVVKELYAKWASAPGVQSVQIGWETYGMQTDDEYVQEKMLSDQITMDIKEVNWVRDGQQAKPKRVERLEPYFRNSQFFMPPKIWHPDHGVCSWKPNPEVTAETPEQILYTPLQGETTAEREARSRGEPYRIVPPIRRLDEQGNIYDLTRMFIAEFIMFPFTEHDDLIDATSRIQDMEVVAPVVVDRVSMQHISTPDA